MPAYLIMEIYSLLTQSFETQCFGKWILAGEHTVLRGGPALVFPIYDYSMDFKWSSSEDLLSVEFLGEFGSELSFPFWGVLERALSLCDKGRDELKGKLLIESSLPLGGGLGGSAALSVGVARLFDHWGWIKDKNIFKFSKSLEDLFHGESSGVDIAPSVYGKGVCFYKNGDASIIEQNWSPKWYLSYSGRKGVTSECVKKVKSLIEKSPELAFRIDERMNQASIKAIEALAMNEEDGLRQLANAVDNACQCFTQWGLIGSELGAHLQKLLQSGALAVKPTGSGGGGFILSLWKTDPSEEMISELRKL